ncbi:MAG: glycosyltransferase family 2 protein [Hasllibacter sp.]
MNGARPAIVIPAHDAGPWIAKTVESALAQRPFAVVAVDDGSADDTLARLRAFGDRIEVLTGPNRGACAARNRGWAHAAGMGATHALFLDADDYLEGPLLRGMAEVAGRTGADLVIGNMHLEYPGAAGAPPVREERFLYGDGKEGGRVPPEEFLIGWKHGDYVNPSGLLWSAALLGRVGGWDEGLARNQDLDITLRALMTRPHVEKSEGGAAIHARVNPNSITRQTSARAQESRFRAHRGIAEAIEAGGLDEFRPALGRLHEEIYLIRVGCLRDGHHDLAARIGDWLAARGWRGHVGTRAHRVLSSLLGLERKTRLSNAIRRLRGVPIPGTGAWTAPGGRG